MSLLLNIKKHKKHPQHLQYTTARRPANGAEWTNMRRNVARKSPHGVSFHAEKRIHKSKHPMPEGRKKK